MADKKAIQKFSKPLKYQTLAVGVTVFLSPLLGMLANTLLDSQISCAFGPYLACNPNSIFVYLFGFYLGLFFTISFTHFTFIKHPSRYYYVLIGLLLASSLILIELFFLALGYTAAGILAGVLVSKLRSRKEA